MNDHFAQGLREMVTRIVVSSPVAASVSVAQHVDVAVPKATKPALGNEQ